MMMISYLVPRGGKGKNKKKKPSFCLYHVLFQSWFLIDPNEASD